MFRADLARYLQLSGEVRSASWVANEFLFLLERPEMDRCAVRDRLRRRRVSPGSASRWRARRASALLERVTAGYIALFQGTPLLMQLFVVYYGLALIGLKLDAWVAVVDRLHAACQRLSRRDLARLDRGRAARPDRSRQGAQPHYVSRMKDVVLPQALRISLPATIGFLVQLIKGTSLAAIVGFTELTRAGNIVSNQIFQPLLVFGIVGALYFAMCWPLSLYGARLERRFATAAAMRRAGNSIKQDVNQGGNA